ncbi:unnamed protein product, partial [Ectocarpus sp. 8 AP-2014]
PNNSRAPISHIARLCVCTQDLETRISHTSRHDLQTRTAAYPAPRASISADIARKARSGASPRCARHPPATYSSFPGFQSDRQIYDLTKRRRTDLETNRDCTDIKTRSTRTRGKKDNSGKHAPHTEHRYQRISPGRQEAGPHRGYCRPATHHSQ